MQELVTIRSNDGEWSQEGVLVSNDPVFCNLGKLHVDGVIILDEELSKTFKECWPYYIRITDWIQEINSPIKGRKQGLQPMWARDALRGEGVVKRMNTPLVYYHQVEKLIGIINMPEHWEMVVAVDERHSPKAHVVRHILYMGTKMRELGYSEAIGTLSDPGRDGNIALSFLYKILSEVDRSEDVRAHSIYWGLMRNCLLRTIEEYSYERIAWPTVVWNAIPSLLRTFSIKSEHLEEFSKFMHGDGGDASLAKTIVVRWEIMRNKVVLDEVRGMELYEKFYATLPIDTDPMDLGLLASKYMYSTFHETKTKLSTLVQDAHVALAMKTTETYSEWASRFSDSVGNFGTQRAILSLLHAIEKEQSGDVTGQVKVSVINELATALEEAVKDAPQSPTDLVLIL